MAENKLREFNGHFPKNLTHFNFTLFLICIIWIINHEILFESHARNCILIKYSLDSGNSIARFLRVWLWSFVALYLSYARHNWTFGKWLVLNDNVSKFKLQERNTYSSALSHLFDNICLILFFENLIICCRVNTMNLLCSMNRFFVDIFWGKIVSIHFQVNEDCFVKNILIWNLEVWVRVKFFLLTHNSNMRYKNYRKMIIFWSSWVRVPRN
jgi:hypothetical protein